MRAKRRGWDEGESSVCLAPAGEELWIDGHDSDWHRDVGSQAKDGLHVGHAMR